MITLYNIQVTEGTITEPVTLSDTKAWIRGLEGTTDFDAQVTTMITAARQDIENWLNVKLVDSSVSLYMDSTNPDKDVLIALPYTLSLPSTVTAVKVARGTADQSLTPDSDYYLNGSLAFVSTGSFKVNYTVGVYVPETIKEAIMMLVDYRFTNRGDQEKQMGMPEDIASKISKYKMNWL